MKKKVDARVRTLIENCVKTNHRSMFVLVGDHGKDQVVNLHYILSKSAVKARPSVLWCYKKELGFSSHKQKRMRQIKKQIQRGLYDPKKEDPFELFIATSDIRWCYYKETHKVLGQTYGMCVLQDFEALTPNLLARTIETVEGGGCVVLLLRSMSSLKQLYTLQMDVHARFRTESHGDVVPRFNERFILSLGNCAQCMVVDDELNVLPLSKHMKDLVPVDMSSSSSLAGPSSELKELQQELNETDIVGALVDQAKSMDQAKAVLTFVEAIAEKTLKSTVALTAARGRGKSAALGLSIAAAVAYGYANIFVTAPSPENLSTVFQFILKGLEVLKYKEHVDFELIQSTNPDFHHAIVRLNIFREHRQTIQYIAPSDSAQLAQAELVVIDEAAAIPLPLVKALLGPYLVFLSSTVNGYEGTGRSLSMKLLAKLRQSQSSAQAQAVASASAAVKGSTKSRKGGHEARWAAAADAYASLGSSSSGTSLPGRQLQELTLVTPIRYGSGDGVERWLNALLCLECTPGRVISGTPAPDACELYAVNRDALFSYHKLSEQFLQRIMALYVSSHYKNQPNDLQLLSDAPAHQIFVLLGPEAEDQGMAGAVPDILCVLQVALEGEISRESVTSQLRRGTRGNGDLIPWTVAQQFQDSAFASLSGARIVRIATHPDLTSMGYGSRAVRQLVSYYQGELYNENEENEENEENAPTELETVHIIASGTTLTQEKVKPRKTLPPLLVPVSEQRPEALHWIGSSFGLTSDLFRFWHKLEFSSVYIRQTPNGLTGEHSAILLRTLTNNNHTHTRHSQATVVDTEHGWLEAFVEDARRRFLSLMAFEFRAFHVKLALGLANVGETTQTTPEDKDNHEQSSSRTSSSLTAEALLRLITPFDLKRLDSYAKNMVDYHMIVDLLPTLARMYFLKQVHFHLSFLQQAILLGMGLQHQSIDVLVKEFDLPANQLLALFNRSMRKFSTTFQQTLVHSEEQAFKDSKYAIVKTAEVSAKAMAATETSLEQELNEGAKEAQKQLIEQLELDQYAVKGTDEDWQGALAGQASVQIPTSKRKKADDNDVKDNDDVTTTPLSKNKGKSKSAKKHKKYKNVTA